MGERRAKWRNACLLGLDVYQRKEGDTYGREMYVLLLSFTRERGRARLDRGDIRKVRLNENHFVLIACVAWYFAKLFYSELWIKFL